MPYRLKTLAGANAAALAQELRDELDAALTAHPAWTKVTNNVALGSLFNQDVWANSGAADGYPWFLIVARHRTAAYTMLGGALEFDPATNIAKKALRGSNIVGFVDAAGYPLVAAGGAEMTFPLGTFTFGITNSVGLLGGTSAAPTTVATAGDWCRTLVTDQIVWQGYGGASTLDFANGVGTYKNMHSTTEDLKPLSFVGGTGVISYGTSVWQHPSAADGGYSRSVASDVNGSAGAASIAASHMQGIVGGTPDLHLGGFVGARVQAVRVSNTASKESPTTYPTAGYFLGIAPADLLVFSRAAGCAIGDTVTVGGKVYVSVSTPKAVAGLFINTTPAV